MMELRPGPEHFRVVELPAYAPSGTGEHAWLRIEKTARTTDDVVRVLARLFGCRSRDIGFAGRKDRRGITEQVFTVYDPQRVTIDEARLAAEPGLRLLERTRHGNKLRLGHLHGNAFTLGVLVPAAAREQLLEACTAVATSGFGNAFGAQRFGRHGATLRAARAIAQSDHATAVATLIDPNGDWRPGKPLPGDRSGLLVPLRRAIGRRPDDPAAALAAGGKQLQQMLASSAQAAIFNAVYEARAAAGTLHHLDPEDLVRIGKRCVAAAEAPEGWPTGPLPGQRMPQPGPHLMQRERAWSARLALDWDLFDRQGPFASPGERRALCIRCLEAPRYTTGPDDSVVLHCTLPAGVYATSLLTRLGIACERARGT